VLHNILYAAFAFVAGWLADNGRDDETAAVVLEPMQGENGVVVPPVGYLQAARRITSEHGALLWLDEIQTGIGRTGTWFAFEPEGITPDLVTVLRLASRRSTVMALSVTAADSAPSSIGKPLSVMMNGRRR
jgi:4-aminobutyrate aminotransferase-like enzyme